MKYIVTFEWDNGEANIDMVRWIINRSVSDTNYLVKAYLSPANNKKEVLPKIKGAIEAFKNGDITDRPVGYLTNKTIRANFNKRITRLEEAIKKWEG